MGSQLVPRSCSDTVCDKRARSTGAEMKMDSAPIVAGIRERGSLRNGLATFSPGIIGVSFSREIEGSTKVARRVCLPHQGHFSSNGRRTRHDYRSR